MHPDERLHVDRLAGVLGAKARRDECGDACIVGKRGNIHADGTGFSVAVMLDTARAWAAARKKLGRFCRLVAAGDTEGVLHLPGLPTREQAAALRAVLGIAKRPVYTPELLEAKRAVARAARQRLTARGFPARHSTILASGYIRQGAGQERALAGGKAEAT